MTRKRLWIWSGAFLAAIFAYLLGVFLINANLTPQAESLRPSPMAGLPDAVPTTLSVTSWNLGYAGLGADANFIADGGNALLPPSRGSVERNIEGIVATLGDIDADMVLFQEVSNRSPLSYWVAMRERLTDALRGRQVFYRPDAATRFIPFPLALDHGTLSATRFNPTDTQIVPLPSEPGAMLGFLKRRYALHVMRFAVEGRSSELVVANLHLSAFDDGGNTRQAQIDAVLAFAEEEYAKGNFVVLGGDWNMVLSDPGVSHTTDERFLFWIYPFPSEKLAEGWSIVSDPATPTVRTLQKPYVAGENYVTSIDGFVISPNVTLRSVRTLDQQFRFSDHHPVTATLELR